MTDKDRDPPIGDQLLEEAATWFARMRGPDAEESRPGFEAWLGRGAMHRRAYNRASEIFTMGKLLAAAPESAEQPRLEHSDRRRRSPAVWLAVAAAALVAGAGWLLITALHDHRQGQQIATINRIGQQGPLTFATSAGQIRAIRLGDGSVVTLQAATRLAVDLGASLRDLRLEQGQARFQVAHEARPFVVHAGGGSVTARGTLFDVALTADRRVSVELIEGTVDVSLPVRLKKQRPQVRRLRPGESVSFAAREKEAPGATNKAATSDLVRAAGASARDYDDVRLADLVAEANRGATRKIRLARAGMGERRVSGHFRVDDPDLLADRLAALFDFTALRMGPDILLK